MNMIRGAKTDEEMERVDGYLKAHCPVAHGYQIGGMYAAPIMETAGAERRAHLRQRAGSAATRLPPAPRRAGTV